jgi:hypothetical protein
MKYQELYRSIKPQTPRSILYELDSTRHIRFGEHEQTNVGSSLVQVFNLFLHKIHAEVCLNFTSAVGRMSEA